MDQVTDLPVRVDWEAYVGATWRLTWTWKEGDPAAAVDLTGYTAVLEVRDGAGAAVMTLTEVAGLTLGGVAGTVAAEATPVLTAAVAPGVYEYDLLLTAPAGRVTALSAGLGRFRLGPRP